METAARPDGDGTRTGGGRPARDAGGAPAPMLARSRFLVLLFLTVACMLPVTGPVPVLKPLVADHYGLGPFGTSTFLSLNMLGALVAAPLVGWLSDRYGWTRRLLVVAAALDAALWAALAAWPPFWALSALRLVEGMAHIAVLSLLLTIVSRTSGLDGRRARMAGAGAAIVLGVALGAPLGGLLGRTDPTLPLSAGAGVMVLVAVVAAATLPALPHRPDPAALPAWPRLHAPPPLRLPYLFSFVDRLTVGFFVTAFPLLTAGVLGLGSGRTGLLIGTFMLPFALLNYPAGKLADRVGPWRLVLAGSTAYAVGYAAIPWTPPAALLPLMAACGVASALMFGPTLVLVLARSTPETRSSAVAGFNAAGSLGFLVGPLAAGTVLALLQDGAGLAERDAHRITFALGGLVQLAAVGWAAARLGRDRPRA